MTEFGEDEVQEWEKLSESATWREEQPYRLCPHCGEYKFRAIRRRTRGQESMDLSSHTYKERCKNCKYHGEEWEDEDD